MTRDEEIAKYLKLADNWVRGFIAKKPEFAGDYDDISTEVKIKVIKAIDGPRKRATFEHFLRIITKATIADYLRKEYVRRPKFRNAISISCFRDFRDRGETVPTKLDEIYNGYDPLAMMVSMCKDDMDRLIVSGRLEGLSRSKIATTLNISRSKVARRLKQLQERYERATR